MRCKSLEPAHIHHCADHSSQAHSHGLHLLKGLCAACDLW